MCRYLQLLHHHGVVDGESDLFRTLFFLFETLLFSLAVLHQSTQCIEKCEVSHPDILQAA